MGPDRPGHPGPTRRDFGLLATNNLRLAPSHPWILPLDRPQDPHPQPPIHARAPPQALVVRAEQRAPGRMHRLRILSVLPDQAAPVLARLAHADKTLDVQVARDLQLDVYGQAHSKSVLLVLRDQAAPVLRDAAHAAGGVGVQVADELEVQLSGEAFQAVGGREDGAHARGEDGCG